MLTLSTSTAVSPSRRCFVLMAAGASTGLLWPPLARGESGQTSSEATIRSGENIVTLVNVFTVEPGRLKDLVQVLEEGTETFFSKMPGFVSSSVLTTRDGAKAINYSQWKSAEDIAGFRKDERFAPYVRRLSAFAKSESMECEVVHVTRA